MGSLRFRYHWALLLYCLLDLLAFSQLAPYDPVGAQLLANPHFTHGLQGWRLEGDAQRVQVRDGLLRIDHAAVSHTTSLSQCYLAKGLPGQLLLSAKAASHGVVRGRKSWHEARIDLVGYDAQGEGDYRVRTRLIGLDGDQTWVKSQRVYRNVSDYRKICVEVSLYGATGAFQVRELSLHQARENPSYRWVSLSLLGGWVVLGLWLLKALYEYYRGGPWGPYLLSLFALLLIGVLMPQALRSGLEQQILSLSSHLGLVFAPGSTLHHGAGLDLWPQRWDLSKIAHLVGFTLLAGLLFWERRTGTTERLFGLLLLAMATELLQFYVPDRTPRVSDLMVDALGILVGWGLGYLLRHFTGNPPPHDT